MKVDLCSHNSHLILLVICQCCGQLIPIPAYFLTLVIILHWKYFKTVVYFTRSAALNANMVYTVLP